MEQVLQWRNLTFCITQPLHSTGHYGYSGWSNLAAISIDTLHYHWPARNNCFSSSTSCLSHCREAEAICFTQPAAVIALVIDAQSTPQRPQCPEILGNTVAVLSPWTQSGKEGNKTFSWTTFYLKHFILTIQSNNILSLSHCRKGSGLLSADHPNTLQ